MSDLLKIMKYFKRIFLIYALYGLMINPNGMDQNDAIRAQNQDVLKDPEFQRQMQEIDTLIQKKQEQFQKEIKDTKIAAQDEALKVTKKLQEKKENLILEQQWFEKAENQKNVIDNDIVKKLIDVLAIEVDHRKTLMEIQYQIEDALKALENYENIVKNHASHYWKNLSDEENMTIQANQKLLTELERAKNAMNKNDQVYKDYIAEIYEPKSQKYKNIIAESSQKKGEYDTKILYSEKSRKDYQKFIDDKKKVLTDYKKKIDNGQFRLSIKETADYEKKIADLKTSNEQYQKLYQDEKKLRETRDREIVQLKIDPDKMKKEITDMKNNADKMQKEIAKLKEEHDKTKKSKDIWYKWQQDEEKLRKQRDTEIVQLKMDHDKEIAKLKKDRDWYDELYRKEKDKCCNIF